MKNTDKRVDDYISKSADFAKPVLNHLRELVHKANPDVQETMKWSFPHFDYQNEMMCSMAAFKHHCAFGFRKASIMKDPENILTLKDREAMGHLGQIKSLKDLPSDKVLMQYIKEAVNLNKDGVKLPSKAKSTETKTIEVPDYFKIILRKNSKAEKTFEEFSYSHKKEYVQWITEAKTDETRQKRIITAVEWLSEGKKKNWKYEKC